MLCHHKLKIGEKKIMNRKIRSILQLLLAADLCVPLYILLHELGHLSVMLSEGGTIEDFSILGAHVIASGGNYSKADELWLHANGACLPVICLIVYLLFYKKDHTSPFYHFFSYVVCTVSNWFNACLDHYSIFIHKWKCTCK